MQQSSWYRMIIHEQMAIRRLDQQERAEKGDKPLGK